MHKFQLDYSNKEDSNTQPNVVCMEFSIKVNVIVKINIMVQLAHHTL